MSQRPSSTSRPDPRRRATGEQLRPRGPGSRGWLLKAQELVGTPAKINFCPAELVAVEGQDFSVHALAAIRFFCLVCDDDFIAGLDEPNKFDHSAFTCARPATFKIPCAVQVWIRWSGKGKIVCQVFLNKVTVTLGEGAVIFFCDLDSTAHPGFLLILIVCAYHDCTSGLCGSTV